MPLAQHSFYGAIERAQYSHAGGPRHCRCVTRPHSWSAEVAQDVVVGRVLDEVQQVLEGALAGDSGLVMQRKNMSSPVTGRNSSKDMCIGSSTADEPPCPIIIWHRAASSATSGWLAACSGVLSGP